MLSADLDSDAAECFQLVRLPIAVDAVLPLVVRYHAELMSSGGMMVAEQHPTAATNQRLFTLAPGISGRLVVRRLMQLANIAPNRVLTP